MEHALYTLVAHPDVEKLDLEDEIVRKAGSSLLAVASTIDRLVIDVHTERRIETPFATSPWDASVLISATNPVDIEPAIFETLIADAAILDSAWMVTNHEVSDLPSEWIGNATPGVKLNFALVRAPGVDHGSYDGWLREAMNDCAERDENMGCRYSSQLSQLRGDASLDSVASFWFHTEADLESALAGRVLEPVLESTVIDAERSLTQTVVEHRLVPNPNAWPVDDAR